MRKGIIFSLIIFCAAAVYPQKTLSLSEVVKIALQKNTNVQKAEQGIQVYKSGVKSAYGDLLPSLSASGGWNWSRTVEEGGDYNIGGVTITAPKKISQNRNYSAGASANLTLFDGLSNFANISKSENNLEAAKYSLERTRQNIAYLAMSGFYDVINAKKLMEVKELDLKWNQKNYEIILERNKLGNVTLADVYAQQVKVGNAELELIRAKNSYETTRSEYLYYLGLDVLEDYSFDDPTINGNELTLEMIALDPNLKSLIEKALTNRSDFKSAKLNYESALDDITIAKAGHLPSLSNYYSYGTNANQVKQMFKSYNTSVGLSLNIPIFSGFSVENRVEQALVQAKNSELDVNDLERQIKKEMQKTYLDLQASEKRVDVSRNNVTAASENRKIEQEKYSLGATMLLNVLIANSDYTNALTNYVNAQFEYVKLKEQLEYSLGILDYKKFE
ncbi:MAG: TolC family protein [Ignavibacteria bacterium]|nr:TolC family protein [Ignavibacteria bacterium]